MEWNWWGFFGLIINVLILVFFILSAMAFFQIRKDKQNNLSTVTLTCGQLTALYYGSIIFAVMSGIAVVTSFISIFWPNLSKRWMGGDSKGTNDKNSSSAVVHSHTSPDGTTSTSTSDGSVSVSTPINQQRSGVQYAPVQQGGPVAPVQQYQPVISAQQPARQSVSVTRPGLVST